MVKKLILICLIGLLGLVGLPSAVGAYGMPNEALWLAQTETTPQTMPAEQPSQKPSQTTEQKPSTVSPATNQQQEKPQDEQVKKDRSKSEPFSPYDMEALRRFDAWDHRS